MKKNLQTNLLVFLLVTFTILASCAHKYYTAHDFDEQTSEHKKVAVVPAEMIFTGLQPKNLTEEDIAKIEESESVSFQYSLYNNILRYANTSKYQTTVNFQDISTTQKLLEQNKISARDSWKMTDKELSEKLGVDAVVRMRIRKQRYMSDAASYGIGVARQVIFNSGIGNKIPVPNVNNKTNDIITSCSLISDGQTLWNDNYTRASDYNSPANDIIESITANFGKHFPYKKKRKK
jgi:hypothetical protein